MKCVSLEKGVTVSPDFLKTSALILIRNSNLNSNLNPRVITARLSNILIHPGGSMRNVFLALFAAFVLVLSACDSTAPKPATICATNTNCDTDGGDNTDGTTDGGDTNGGTGGTGGTDGTDGNGGTGGTGGNGGTDGTGGNGGTTPAPFDHSLMKGFAQGYDNFIKGYKGNQRLTVRALWIDQSTGEIMTISQDDNGQGGNWIETDGEFGIRLKAPADSALATLPIFSPITCGPDANDVINTTTVPANLSSVQGLVVPVLFVFDGEQVVGLIVHGSFYFNDYNQLQYPAKLAMRVYSAADKVIAKGHCSDDLGMDAMLSMIDPTFAAALADVNGAGSSNAGFMQSMMSSQEPASPTISLNVDLGLKKGWNTVVLSMNKTNGSLEFNLIDDTQPNFTWYFISLEDFIPDVEPEMPVDPECLEIVPFNNTGEPTIPEECPVEEPVLQ
jgi:hypothetical protein